MSHGEEELGEILRKEYPTYHIMEQYSIKIQGRTLFLDYYIPLLGLAIEYDGIQHDQYVSHFHREYIKYRDSRYRDSLKDAWCEQNGITLLRINHKEKLTNHLVREKVAQAIKDRNRQ